MANALGVSLVVVTALAGTALVNRMATEDQIRLANAKAIEAQQWALVTRPLCEFYFQWSMQMHDRVPDFEQVCVPNRE